MHINITEDATTWYKKEYEVDTASLRFFARYGGFGGNIPGFSLGVQLEQPKNIHTSIEKDGILFFIDDSDAWYFEDKDLHITLDQDKNEPHFAYQ